MAEIVLHIGTPKTGTTALQSAFANSSDVLGSAGITFLKTGRHHAAHNDLANAIRRKDRAGEIKARLEAEVEAEIARNANQRLLLSSEIFSLIRPRRIQNVLTFLTEHPLKIVVYLRRQDRYIEAFYKQRVKNGRLFEAFDEFLDSQQGRQIACYPRLLSDWRDTFPHADLVPRIYERNRFVGGDVVSDFSAILGIAPGQLAAENVERNVSPSKDVIDLILALAPHLERGELRETFRAIKAMQLDGFSGSGDMFDGPAREAYLTRFQEDDEIVRAAYFPGERQLFKPDETDSRPSPTGLTHRQKELLSVALSAYTRVLETRAPRSG